MTVKTPPTIAHVDVRNWYIGIGSSETTIEIGERSYLKSIDGRVPAPPVSAENLFVCTVYLYAMVRWSRAAPEYTLCMISIVTTFR